MPVEMVGGQAGQHAHPRGGGHLGRLIGGDLHHIGIDRIPPVHVGHRNPDVADEGHLEALMAENGGGEGGGGALPLGAGDGHHRGGGEVLEPDRHGGGDRHPRGGGRGQFGAVPADPRGPHHHVDVPPGDLVGADDPTVGARSRRAWAWSGRSSIRVGTTPRPARRPTMASPSCPIPHTATRRAHSSSRVTPPPSAADPRRRTPPGRGRRGPPGRCSRSPTSAADTMPLARSRRAVTTTVSFHWGRSERILMAAADSRRSPTHSKGLSSSLISAAKPGT